MEWTPDGLSYLVVCQKSKILSEMKIEIQSMCIVNVQYSVDNFWHSNQMKEWLL